MLKSTGNRLFAAHLGYVTLIILVLTLNPFYFVLPEGFSIKFESSFGNLYNNILRFVPLGFLDRLTTGQRGAMLLGLILSFSIEILQLFIPARTTSIVDLMANTLGAGQGVWLYDRVATNLPITASMVNRFRLQMPLMGLVYLLVPLLWIDTLALHETPFHSVISWTVDVVLLSKGKQQLPLGCLHKFSKKVPCRCLVHQPFRVPLDGKTKGMIRQLHGFHQTIGGETGDAKRGSDVFQSLVVQAVDPDDRLPIDLSNMRPFLELHFMNEDRTLVSRIIMIEGILKLVAKMGI